MKISDILKLIFAGTRAEPSPPAKLDSTTEAALAQSVGRLSLGEPGWITMQEGRRLFSPMDDPSFPKISSGRESHRLVESSHDR
jgi:hypothetical protein